MAKICLLSYFFNIGCMNIWILYLQASELMGLNMQWRNKQPSDQYIEAIFA